MKTEFGSSIEFTLDYLSVMIIQDDLCKPVVKLAIESIVKYHSQTLTKRQSWTLSIVCISVIQRHDTSYVCDLTI
jgi:hypothetical protein